MTKAKQKNKKEPVSGLSTGGHLSKGARTRQKIIESAVLLIAEKGIHNVTFDDIAGSSETTRQLVQAYYPSKDIILEECVKIVREDFQNFAVEAMISTEDPKQQLPKYIHSTFDWVAKFPEKAAILTLFHHFCITRKAYRDLNTSQVNIGTQRIANMLVFHIPEKLHKNAKLLAKKIQNIIMGYLYCAATENVSVEDAREDALAMVRLLLSK